MGAFRNKTQRVAAKRRKFGNLEAFSPRLTAAQTEVLILIKYSTHVLEWYKMV